MGERARDSPLPFRHVDDILTTDRGDIQAGIGFKRFASAEEN